LSVSQIKSELESVSQFKSEFTSIRSNETLIFDLTWLIPCMSPFHTLSNRAGANDKC
jgi:hypothetical protein